MKDGCGDVGFAVSVLGLGFLLPVILLALVVGGPGALAWVGSIADAIGGIVLALAAALILGPILWNMTRWAIHLATR